MAAGHLETALRALRDIERNNMLPQERAWELHERMGQLLYWLADLPLRCRICGWRGSCRVRITTIALLH